MKNYTYTQLEEFVLDLLYKKNQERPIWITASEVYWSINEPSVSERDVVETLEKFVKERRVIKQLGKYQIDKIEFLEIKKKKESIVHEEQNNNETSNNEQYTNSEYIQEKEIPKRSIKKVSYRSIMFKFITWIFFLTVGIFIGFIIYDYCTRNSYTITEIEIPKSEIVMDYQPISISTKTDDDIKYSIYKLCKELNKQKEIDRLLIKENKELRKSLNDMIRDFKQSEKKRIAQINKQQNFFLIGLCVVLSLMILVLAVRLTMINKNNS